MELKEMTKRTKIEKSLKFELRPVGKTMDTIRKKELLEQDHLLHEKSNEIRPLYDAYVKCMITDTFLLYGGEITAELLKKNEQLIQIEEQQKEKQKEKKNTKKQKNTENKNKKKEPENKEKKPEDIEKEMQVIVRKFFDRAVPIPIDSIKQGSFITTTLPDFLKKGKMVPTEKYSVEEWMEKLKDVTTTYMEKYAISRIASFDAAAKRVVENFLRYRNNIKKLQAFLVYAEGQKHLKDEACVKELSSAKYLDYYEMCLTESDIEKYNRLVKGISNENGIVQKGINQLINEENQKHRSDRSYNGPIFRILNPLYQQILMPKEKQYSIRKLENNEELNEVMDHLKEMIGKNEMKNVITFLKDTDPDKLILSGKDLHVISHIVFGEHGTIPDELQNDYIDKQMKEMETAKTKTQRKKIQKSIDKAGEKIREAFYSFAEITDFLRTKEHYVDIKASIINHMTSLMLSADTCQKELPKQLFFDDKASKRGLIAYFEPMNQFHRLTKLLKKESDRQDGMVMETLTDLTKDFSLISYTNNLVHNYMTRSAGDMAKEEQICFGVSTKLKTEWWNGEGSMETKDGLLLEKNGKLYFATKTPGQRFNDKHVFAETEDEKHYSIFTQKKAQRAYLILPKLTFSEIKNTKFFKENPEAEYYVLTKGMKQPVLIPKKVFEIKENKAFSKENKNEKDRLNTLWELIDVYKEVALNCIQFEKFHFIWKETKEYKKIDEFFNDIDHASVHTKWRKVSAKKVDAEVESGNLLLFLIWQRHMYRRGLDARNAYAKLFLSIFEGGNMQTNEIRLGSNPKLSFRPASIERKVTHPKGSMVVNRWTKDGRRIPESIHNEIYRCYNGKLPYDCLSDEAKEWYGRATAYRTKVDLIKDRRYTEDKFFISVSYVKNARAKKDDYTLSSEVEEDMKNGFYTMTIARGIEDLLYYQIFDQEQKLVKEGSLNKLFGVDYAEYLQMLSEERRRGKMERWEYDKKVKTIKDAYLNAAIAKVLRISFQYKATIVIESMSTEFKQKWSCIDNQFFSVFEKRIENKLEDYFTADIPLGEPGSVTNPVQAAVKGRSNMIQNGLLFRLNGAYINKIDPYTGFLNLFSLYQYNGTESRRKFFEKFESIEYKDGYFYFCFDYQKFESINYNIQKSKWTVKAGGRRTKFDRSFKYHYMEENIAKKAEEAMEKAGFTGNFVEEMSEIPAYLVNALFDLFKETVTKTIMKKCEGNNEEYLLSPVLGDIPEEKRIKPIQLQGRMLAEKMWFYLNYEENDFTKDWIDKIQEKIA